MLFRRSSTTPLRESNCKMKSERSQGEEKSGRNEREVRLETNKSIGFCIKVNKIQRALLFWGDVFWEGDGEDVFGEGGGACWLGERLQSKRPMPNCPKGAFVKLWRRHSGMTVFAPS